MFICNMIYFTCNIFYMGARIFNSLPMEVWASLADDFWNKVKIHFLDK